MKTAYLWVILERNIRVYPIFADSKRMSEPPDYIIPMRITADYVFSSKEKFEKLWSGGLTDDMQLVEIQVPDDFDKWDFISDNY